MKNLKYLIMIFICLTGQAQENNFEIKILSNQEIISEDEPLEIVLVFQNNSKKNIKLPYYPINYNQSFIHFLLKKNERNYIKINFKTHIRYPKTKKKSLILRPAQKIQIPLIIFYNFKTNKFIFSGDNIYKMKIKFFNDETKNFNISNELEVKIKKNLNKELSKIKMPQFIYSIFKEDERILKETMIEKSIKIELELFRNINFSNSDPTKLWIKYVLAKYCYYEIIQKYKGKKVLKINSEVLIKDPYYIKSLQFFTDCINSNSLYLQGRGSFYLASLYASLKDWKKSFKMCKLISKKYPWILKRSHFEGFIKFVEKNLKKSLKKNTKPE